MTPGETRPRSRIAQHAAVTFVGLMVANLFGYVFYSLISRTLGVEAYGTFSSLIAIVLMLAAPAIIAQMVVAKLATEVAFEPAALRGLIRAIDRAALGAGVIAAVVLALASVPIAAFLHLADPLLVTITAISLGGAIALPLLRGVLQGTSAFRAFALSNVAENLGKAVFAPALGMLAGLRGALAGLAVAYLSGAAYTFFADHSRRRGDAVRLPLRAMARTSASVALAVFCLNVALLFDVVLAKRYLGAYTAGLYGAAALASRAVYAVIAFVPTVLLPQAAIRATRGERTRTLFGQAIGVTAAVCIGAIGLFAVQPRFVITMIAGHAFAAGAPFLLWYVVAVSMLATANVVATYNIARGRMRFVVPLAFVVGGEIVTVVMRHRSAYDLLQTIVIGHTLALVACATALGAARAPLRDVQVSREEP